MSGRRTFAATATGNIGWLDALHVDQMRARSERRGESLDDEGASGGGSSSAAVRIAASHAQDRHLPSPGIRAFAREEVGEEAFTCAVLSAAIYADAPLAPARRPGEESPSASTLLDRLRQHECGLDDAIVLDLSPDGRLAFVARLSGDRPATWTVARGTESGEDVAVDLTYLLLGRPQANPHFKALLRFHDENCRRTERLSELAGFRRYATGHSKAPPTHPRDPFEAPPMHLQGTFRDTPRHLRDTS